MYDVETNATFVIVDGKFVETTKLPTNIRDTWRNICIMNNGFKYNQKMINTAPIIFAHPFSLEVISLAYRTPYKKWNVSVTK